MERVVLQVGALLLVLAVAVLNWHPWTRASSPLDATPSPKLTRREVATANTGPPSRQAVARADLAMRTFPSGASVARPKLRLQAALPDGWAQAARGAPAWATSSGHPPMGAVIMVAQMRLDDLPSIDQMANDIETQLPPDGVTFAGDRSVHAFGVASVLVEGHGVAGTAGYVIDRLLSRVNGHTYVTTISMVDADRDALLPEALQAVQSLRIS